LTYKYRHINQSHSPSHFTRLTFHGFLWVVAYTEKAALDSQALVIKLTSCFARGRWLSPGTPTSSITITGRHVISSLQLNKNVNITYTTIIYPGILLFSFYSIKNHSCRILSYSTYPVLIIIVYKYVYHVII
jgi:hypothetical protein